MNVKKVIDGLHTLCESNLRILTEACIDEYRKRLCAIWDFDPDDCWWIADKTGDELAIGDNFVLDFAEVKQCVEDCIGYDEFAEYWQFTMSEYEAGRSKPRINFNAWFMGLRPEMLNDEE